MKPLLIDCCIVSNALYFALTLNTQQLNQNLQPADKNRDNHSTLFYGGQVPWAINSLQQAVFDSAWFDWIYIISMTDRGGDTKESKTCSTAEDYWRRRRWCYCSIMYINTYS